MNIRQDENCVPHNVSNRFNAKLLPMQLNYWPNSGRGTTSNSASRSGNARRIAR